MYTFSKLCTTHPTPSQHSHTNYSRVHLWKCILLSSPSLSPVPLPLTLRVPLTSALSSSVYNERHCIGTCHWARDLGKASWKEAGSGWDRLCSEHKSVRFKTESLQYTSDLDRGVKSVWTFWLSTLQNIWSNKVCHWFNATNGFFFLWYTKCKWDSTPPPPPALHSPESSQILQVERLSTRWCTKANSSGAKRRGRVSFWPNASESRATSRTWYAAGSMPLR